jgi:glucan 1,3-beta-glucosidase
MTIADNAPAQPPPIYMKDNRGNHFGVAPDKGTLDGPVTTEANLTEIIEHKPKNETGPHPLPLLQRANTDSFWVDNLASAGVMPLAGSGYKFFRNVKDYGAKGDGSTDDTQAINKAITDGNRCGKNCGSTSTQGAIVYFPGGIYVISTPIIQLFYTQFIGDPTNVPIIRGTQNFTGIALIDTDVYIPGGNGAEWYINQNNFFRSIRNFNLDLTYMNATNYDNGQQYFPTGIHWQVAQATSLQNIGINMRTDGPSQQTSTGIFMENGSGGMISDVVFYGGNIGFVAGSQQFTARGLTFTNCLTAVNMLWNWGFTWSQIAIDNTYVGFNVSSNGGSTGQGTGSIAVVDSVFTHVLYGITTHTGGDPPQIILENVVANQSPDLVLVSGGATILNVGDSATVDFWASGYRYIAANGTGSKTTGYLSPAPVRPAALLDPAGEYFWQERPNYSGTSAGGFVVVTQHGVANDGTGDQTAAINSVLSGNVGTPVFFPAGIYAVQGTVQVPVGSIIVGSAWSQIQGSGSYFQDASNPNVMVRVGNPGQSGVIQISDMLFSVKGPTAGAILMEWNVHESKQGSAAMWDSHFRVGGAAGTNLQLADCPSGTTINKNCIAASMLLHLTPQSSGYFENVWAWVADHDLDNPLNAQITEGTDGVPNNVQTNLNIASARGVLIESQGPSWFYGSASEHSVMYQWQLSSAKDIYFGHVQTESAYFQPKPVAPNPFTPGQFPADPDFSLNCTTDDCKEGWAMRIVESDNVMIYSAGFYSWFTSYSQSCLPSESCQQRLFSVEDSNLVWVFNLFTKGSKETASTGNIAAILTNATTQSGYTSEVNVWLPFASNNGSGGGDFGNGNPLYVDPGIWGNPGETVGCLPPCTLLFPPLPLPTPITVTWPPYGTGLYSLSGTVTVTITTTISLKPFTISSIPFWPVTIEPGDPSIGTISPVQSIMPPSTTIVLPPGEAPIQVTDGTASAGSSSSTTIIGGYITYSPIKPTFVSTSRTITIQPMPTIPIPIPPGDSPTPTPTTTVTKGSTTVIIVTTQSHTVPFTRSPTAVSPHCTRGPCGTGNCLFGCNGGCGLFGCNGGCGVLVIRTLLLS